jgi:hypothetical protein
MSTLALFADDIRRSITDTHALLPYIFASLSSPHVGTRFAACHCVRSLSRAVSVLRTNLVDSGVGMKVFEMFKKKDEDRRVISASLGAVCNLVTDFSPLREVCGDNFRFYVHRVVLTLIPLIASPSTRTVNVCS